MSVISGRMHIIAWMQSISFYYSGRNFDIPLKDIYLYMATNMKCNLGCVWKDMGAFINEFQGSSSGLIHVNQTTKKNMTYSGTLQSDHLDNQTTLRKRPLFSRPVLVKPCLNHLDKVTTSLIRPCLAHPKSGPIIKAPLYKENSSL